MSPTPTGLAPPPKLQSPATAERACAPESELVSEATDGIKADVRAGRILIVDDDPDLLKLVSRMVAYLGYDPCPVGDAMDALYYLNQKPFDYVLTDYRMPFLDGCQLAEQIKNKNTGTKVILMTGHCEEAMQRMLDDSGAVDGLLLKPFDLTTLKEKIEAVDRLGAGGSVR